MGGVPEGKGLRGARLRKNGRFQLFSLLFQKSLFNDRRRRLSMLFNVPKLNASVQDSGRNFPIRSTFAFYRSLLCIFTAFNFTFLHLRAILPPSMRQKGFP
jgi:hypothetical protein